MSSGATTSAGREEKAEGRFWEGVVAMGVAWADGWRLLGAKIIFYEGHKQYAPINFIFCGLIVS